MPDFATGGLAPQQETLHERIASLERLREVLSSSLEVLLD
jgi:hypothetical protein